MLLSFSLSEYSDENMMDPYNLGICFGPTLLPIPPDRDQVTVYHYQIPRIANLRWKLPMMYPRDITSHTVL